MQAIYSAQAGLQRAYQRLDASAQRTARLGEPAADVDYAHEAVEQITAKQEASANLAVFRAADDMIGQLLDLKA